jgi:hypothetical protein
MQATAPYTRRYPRYNMHTPVSIAVPGVPNLVVPGLVSKLSRAGLELYAGVNLGPGDLMEIEFRTADWAVHVAGLIRHRTGYCFGLEFCGLRVEMQKPPSADSKL